MSYKLYIDICHYNVFFMQQTEYFSSRQWDSLLGLEKPLLNLQKEKKERKNKKQTLSSVTGINT